MWKAITGIIELAQEAYKQIPKARNFVKSVQGIEEIATKCQHILSIPLSTEPDIQPISKIVLNAEQQKQIESLINHPFVAPLISGLKVWSHALIHDTTMHAGLYAFIRSLSVKSTFKEEEQQLIESAFKLNKTLQDTKNAKETSVLQKQQESVIKDFVQIVQCADHLGNALINGFSAFNYLYKNHSLQRASEIARYAGYDQLSTLFIFINCVATFNAVCKCVSIIVYSDTYYNIYLSNKSLLNKDTRSLLNSVFQIFCLSVNSSAAYVLQLLPPSENWSENSLESRQLISEIIEENLTPRIHTQVKACIQTICNKLGHFTSRSIQALSPHMGPALVGFIIGPNMLGLISDTQYGLPEVPKERNENLYVAELIASKLMWDLGVHLVLKVGGTYAMSKFIAPPLGTLATYLSEAILMPKSTQIKDEIATQIKKQCDNILFNPGEQKVYAESKDTFAKQLADINTATIHNSAVTAPAATAAPIILSTLTPSEAKKKPPPPPPLTTKKKPPPPPPLPPSLTPTKG